MASTCVLGSTGMVGSQILAHLLSSPHISSIDILARREPAAASNPSAKLTTFVEPNTEKWAAHYKTLSPAPSIFFSGLATTRAAAGSFEAQYKIEHGLNLEMARTAKEAGTKVYVLISAMTASTSARFAYSKMKGQLEEDVKALGFEHTIMIRPGLIGGEREESRPSEAAVRKIAGWLGYVNSHHLKDGWVQDADQIGKSAVNMGLKALDGKAPGKIWEVSGREILEQAKIE